MRAVLDTSVLVPGWSQRLLVLLGQAGEYEPVWSEWIIGETWRVLTYLRLKKGHDWERISEEANAMMRIMLPVMVMQSLRTLPDAIPWPGSTDIDDWPIWETARLSAAQYIVSDDVNDFPPLGEEVQHGDHRCQRHEHDGIEYLTAIEFAQGVLGADPAIYLEKEPSQAGRSQRTCPG